MITSSSASAQGPLEGSQPVLVRRPGEKCHVVSGRVGSLGRIRAGGQDMSQLRRGAQDHRRRAPEVPLELAFNACHHVGRAPVRRPEEDVARLYVGRDIAMPECEKALLQVGHGEAPVAGHVDASEQCDVIRHGRLIIGTARWSLHSSLSARGACLLLRNAADPPPVPPGAGSGRSPALLCGHAGVHRRPGTPRLPGRLVLRHADHLAGPARRGRLAACGLGASFRGHARTE